MPQEKPQAESEAKTAAQMVQDMPDIFTGHEEAATPAQKPAETQVAPETKVDAGTQQTQAAAPETAAKPDPFIERLRSLGFADVNDPAAGQERLLQAFEQDRQRATTIEQQIAQLQQQNLILQSQLTQRVQGSDPQSQARDAAHATVQAVAEKAAADPWPKIPQMDMALQQAIKKHQSPDGGWLPTAPADVVAKAGQWEAAVAEWQAKLIFDPKGALEPIIEHKAKELLQQMLGEDPRKFVEQQYETIQQQATVEQQVASAWDRAFPWMFQADPLTREPNTRMPTEFGQRFQRSFAQAQEQIRSINPQIDENSLFQHALQQTYFRHEQELASLEQRWQEYQESQQAAPAAAATPAAPPPPKEDPRAAMQRQHLERNRVAPANGSRAGAVETDERGRKRQKSQGLNRIAEDTVSALSGDGFFTP